MSHKLILPFILIMLLCSSCGLNIRNESIFTATPGFVTATLPPTRIPPPMNTAMPVMPTPVTVEDAAPPSVEGKTTTQLNVRAETSTASKTLGIIKAYETIQVTGRDASGSWYQILYADSETGKGWVRAEYVQVNAAAQIPVIGGETGSGSGVSGLVLQQINVRSGPGTTFEALGILNPKDVVFITGKDANGEWIQIKFGSAGDGKGWLTAKYLQIENPDSIPVIGTLEPSTGTPASVNSTPIPVPVLSAAADGDSQQAPMAAVTFSAVGTHALQVSGDVSAPNGDAEDWIQFSPYTSSVLVQAKCSSGELSVELWSAGQFAKDVRLACGGKSVMTITQNQIYFFRIQAAGPEPRYVQYTIKITGIE